MGERGKHTAPKNGGRRWVIVVAIIVIAVLAGGGILYARGRSEGNPTPTASPSRSKKPKPSRSPSVTPTPTPTPSIAPSPSTSPSAAPSTFREGGQHAYITAATAGTGASITANVVQYYTGAKADEVASEHGDPPPPDGYYIVASGPNGVRGSVSPGVAVRYQPVSGGSARTGTYDAFVRRAAGKPVAGDWPQISSALWRITVSGGLVTRIDQVYLP
jgi:hypothetical protein